MTCRSIRLKDPWTKKNKFWTKKSIAFENTRRTWRQRYPNDVGTLIQNEHFWKVRRNQDSWYCVSRRLSIRRHSRRQHPTSSSSIPWSHLGINASRMSRNLKQCMSGQWPLDDQISWMHQLLRCKHLNKLMVTQNLNEFHVKHLSVYRRKVLSVTLIAKCLSSFQWFPTCLFSLQAGQLAGQTKPFSLLSLRKQINFVAVLLTSDTSRWSHSCEQLGKISCTFAWWVFDSLGHYH